MCYFSGVKLCNFRADERRNQHKYLHISKLLFPGWHTLVQKHLFSISLTDSVYTSPERALASTLNLYYRCNFTPCLLITATLRSRFIGAVLRATVLCCSSLCHKHTVGARLCFNRPVNALAILEPSVPVQAFHGISVAAPQLLEASLPSLKITPLKRNLPCDAELKLDRLINLARICTCRKKKNYRAQTASIWATSARHAFFLFCRCCASFGSSQIGDSAL